MLDSKTPPAEVARLRPVMEAAPAPLDLCTDNAAMIGSAARYVEPLAPGDYDALDAYATGERGL